MSHLPSLPRLPLRRWMIVAIALIVSLPSFAARAADVIVFAAASLKESLDEQARLFQTQTGHRVIVSFGASNALARQIEAGAPADLFISADSEWMNYVEQHRLLAAQTRVDLLRNSLVLIAPASSTVFMKIEPHFPLAAALGKDKLAMANPDSVPAGKYGKSALQSLGVWNSVERNVVRAENVRAALVLVARREAPFGIVYATDAGAESGVKIVGTFPPGSHPPIVYPAAMLATSKSSAARALLEYLHSAQARAVWTRHGFVSALAAAWGPLALPPSSVSAAVAPLSVPR